MRYKRSISVLLAATMTAALWTASPSEVNAETPSPVRYISEPQGSEIIAQANGAPGGAPDYEVRLRIGKYAEAEEDIGVFQLRGTGTLLQGGPVRLDGQGTRTPSPETDPLDPRGGRDMADLLAYGTDEDGGRYSFAYISGELGKAYEPSPAGLPRVTRSMVTMPTGDMQHPLAIFVFDRVKTEQSAPLSFHLSSNAAPVIDGNRADFQSGQESASSWTLLPQQAELGTGPQGSAHELNVTGQDQAYPGLFLHAIAASYEGTPAAVEPMLLASGNAVGARLFNKTVFFSKNGAPLSDLHFQVEGEGLQDILLTDLNKGYYLVERKDTPSGAFLLHREVTECGCLHFKGNPGQYVVTRATVDASIAQRLIDRSTGDTVAPAITPVSPAAGLTVSGTIELAATATDNDGVAGVQFRINGYNIGPELASDTERYATEWDSREAADGTYTMTAIARDATGHHTESEPVAITVRNNSGGPGGPAGPGGPVWPGGPVDPDRPDPDEPDDPDVPDQSPVVAIPQRFVSESTAEDGTVLVHLDTEAMLTWLADEAGEGMLRVTSASAADSVELLLETELWETMLRLDPSRVLAFDTPTGSYRLPLAVLPSSLEGSLQDGLEHVAIRISLADASLADPLLAASDLSRIAPLVAFELFARSGTREVMLQDFGSTFIPRSIPFDPGAAFDPNRSTGIAFDSDTGSWQFVPSRFVQEDGSWRVWIQRNRNSLYTVISGSVAFDDMAGHWAQQEVETLAAKQIVFGMSSSAYEPHANVTRAQFMTLLVRALGVDVEGAERHRFSDVAADSWYADAVHWAADNGLVQGYPDGTFGPHRPISRQELALMTLHVLEYLGQAANTANGTAALERFQDHTMISDWARQAVAMQVESGLMTGRSPDQFVPGGETTRAESAVVLLRFLRQVGFVNS
ncbi:S-layer homology domain-containing protein [Paenibacillus sp. 1P07SE]|uniref:S-layer homology domain-containing protein n=1 Tax=Paenibacillus sp. 1P07SE TaxID=3132209 RepID=UPI0039A4AFBD